MIDFFGFRLAENFFFSAGFVVVAVSLLGFLISCLIYLEALKNGLLKNKWFVLWTVFILIVPYGSLAYYLLFLKKKPAKKS
jgi:hypothetical protein